MCEEGYFESPYGKFKIIEVDCRDHTDEYYEFVVYCEPNGEDDE